MGVRTIGTDQITYHFGPDVAPVLEAEPGDTVVFETLDASSGRIRRFEDIAAYTRVRDPERVNPATGPVAVRGAEPGDELRVEHEDHAKSHGRRVGANMAGADEPYDHLPFFYSDLFELGYEAVGAVDSRLETIAEWSEPHHKGVVAYLDDERRQRGFLLWGIFGKVDAATELIRSAEPVDAASLKELSS